MNFLTLRDLQVGGLNDFVIAVRRGTDAEKTSIVQDGWIQAGIGAVYIVRTQGGWVGGYPLLEYGMGVWV